LGQGGKRIEQNGETEVWAKALEHGEYAVALFNRGESETETAVKWKDIGFGETAKARDLWTHQNPGSLPLGFSAKVPAHGVVMIRVSR
ncbi:MAG TPA: hypothetical protein VHB50_11080, partial [Bryobacteraceae bacterium]|nr:hypothetical protein [Bryobacteraceae bacterium]